MLRGLRHLQWRHATGCNWLIPGCAKGSVVQSFRSLSFLWNILQSYPRCYCTFFAFRPVLHLNRMKEITLPVGTFCQFLAIYSTALKEVTSSIGTFHQDVPVSCWLWSILLQHNFTYFACLLPCPPTSLHFWTIYSPHEDISHIPLLQDCYMWAHQVKWGA